MAAKKNKSKKTKVSHGLSPRQAALNKHVLENLYKHENRWDLIHKALHD